MSSKDNVVEQRELSLLYVSRLSRFTMLTLIHYLGRITKTFQKVFHGAIKQSLKNICPRYYKIKQSVATYACDAPTSPKLHLYLILSNYLGCIG